MIHEAFEIHELSWLNGVWLITLLWGIVNNKFCGGERKFSEQRAPELFRINESWL
jgi:hypothetical protein